MTSPLRRRQQSTTPLHHRPLPQLLLDVPELAVVRLPSELTRSPSRSPSRSPRPDFNRRDTFKRAATYSTFEASKRGWAQIVEHHILRKPVRVTALFGEKPGLLESELGPHATVARWARLNRARPWPLRLLHPNSVERRAIDATTSLLVTLSVLQVPLQAIFAWWPYLRLSATGFAAFNFAMRAWFVIELFLNLRTGKPLRAQASSLGPLSLSCADANLERQLTCPGPPPSAPPRPRVPAPIRRPLQATSGATARS